MIRMPMIFVDSPPSRNQKSPVALYVINFDYGMVKVKMYTRIPLSDITGIKKGLLTYQTFDRNRGTELSFEFYRGLHSLDVAGSESFSPGQLWVHRQFPSEAECDANHFLRPTEPAERLSFFNTRSRRELNSCSCFAVEQKPVRVYGRSSGHHVVG